MTPTPAVELLAPPMRQRAKIWAACYLLAAMWLGVTDAVGQHLGTPWLAAWVIAPAVITVTAVPEVRGKWWRWPLVWALFSVTTYSIAPLVLVIGSGWIVSDAFITRATYAVDAAHLTTPATPSPGDELEDRRRAAKAPADESGVESTAKTKKKGRAAA